MKQIRYYFIAFIILILSFKNISCADECKYDPYDPYDGYANQAEFGFSRERPYPKSWTSQDIQDYKELGNWTCQFHPERVAASAPQVFLSKSEKDSEKVFFAKSAIFAQKHPQSIDIWILRGDIALQVGDVHAGWEAGQKLTAYVNGKFLHEEEEAPFQVENDAGSTKPSSLLEELKAKGWVTHTYETALAKQQRKNNDYMTKKSVNCNGRWMTQYEFDLLEYKEHKREVAGIKSQLQPYSKARTKEQIQNSALQLLKSSKPLSYPQQEFLKEYKAYKASGYDPDLKPNSNQIIPDSKDCHRQYYAVKSYCIPVCNDQGKNCRMYCRYVPAGNTYYVFHGKRVKSLEGLCPTAY